MPRLPKRVRKFLFGLLGAALAVLFVLFLVPSAGSLSAIRQDLEKVLYDFDWSLRFAFEEEGVERKSFPEPDIVVVDIDESSLEELGPYHFWPRTHHAEVVKRLSDGGAAAVLFDILFKNADFGAREAERADAVLGTILDERERERVRPLLRHGFDADSAFVEAVRASGRVVAGATAGRKDSYSGSTWEPFSTEEWFRRNNPASAFESEWISPWRWPLLDNVFPELSQAAGAVGLVNVVADKDGVHRSEPLLHAIPFPATEESGPTRLYPVLALQGALRTMGASPSEIHVEPDRGIVLPPPLRLFSGNGELRTSAPHVAGEAVLELLARKDEILALAPGSDPVRVATSVTLSRTEEGDLEADVEDGQTLEGALLDSVFRSEGDEDLALTDEDDEEVTVSAYTARLLRRAKPLADSLPPGGRRVLSREIQVRRAEDGSFSSDALLLRDGLLRALLALDADAVRAIGPGETLAVGEPALLPTDGDGRLLLRFAGRGKSAFKTVSYADVLKGRLDDGFYNGRIFLLGSTASALFDIVSAPGERAYPGIFLHATLLENILDGHSVVRAGEAERALAVVLLALLVALLAWRLEPLPSLALVLVLGVGVFALEFKWFVEKDLWFGLVDPWLTLLCSYLAALILKYLFEERDKRHAVEAFKSYISPELIDQMLENDEMPALGGQKKLLTAYFTDIQSFSTFSEKIGDAAKLVELINEYLTAMTDILLKNGGTLDKYEGDAIIAFFGAPVEVKEHALRAVLAALEMQRKLGELRAKWASEGGKWPAVVHEMRMRVGINSGEIVTGNMGSSVRMNYTMMGDDVNLAARLESGAKQYGVYVLVSRATAELAGDSVVFRPIDRLRVVGKSEPVEVLEPLCERKELDERTESLLRLWDEARDAYLAMEWEKAKALFEQCDEHEPNRPDRAPGCRTTPSRVFAERCALYAERPPVAPGEPWDGVHVATSK